MGSTLKCGIYILLNKSNGKKYVGLSKDINKRWIAHKSKLRLDKHKNKHLQRTYNQGVRFEYIILELCDESKLYEREKYWGKLYDVVKLGYNMMPCGIENPILKGSESPNYNHNKRYWFHKDYDTEYLTNYDMVRKHGLCQNSVSLLVRGKGYSVKGWQLNPIPKPSLYTFYHKDGRTEKNISIDEMVIKYNLGKGALSQMINGKIKSYKGWTILK